MPRLVALEGNIGAGKSTVLDVLEGRGYRVLREGLATWGDVLTQFYRQPDRWAFSLQTAILLHQHEQRARLTGPDAELVFVERSPTSAALFVRNSAAEGHMSPLELRLYERMHAALAWTADATVLVHTDPTVCYDRMRARARPAEAGVRLDYVRRIGALHAEHFRACPRVDGARPPDAVADAVLAAVRA